MIANYGYKDGSGEFFIIVDTEKCANCSGKPCVAACPESIFEIIEDDYDDKVIVVKKEHRNKVKYTCAPCKPTGGRVELPCIKVCPSRGIKHSW